MGAQQKSFLNGDSPSSKTLDHITSYPCVHDSISFYKNQPIGQQSIDLANNVYGRFFAPFVSQLRGPYSWVAPYVERADDLGDQGLTRVEKTFPIVKEDSEKVRDALFNVAFFPLRVAMQSKDYALNTWHEEYNRTNGQGIVKLVKAGISTELRVAGDVYVTVFHFLRQKKEEGDKATAEYRKKANDYKKQAEDGVNGYRKQAEDSLNGFKKQAEDGVSKYKKQAEDGYNNTKKQAEDGYKGAKKQTEDTVNGAKNKAEKESEKLNH